MKKTFKIFWGVLLLGIVWGLQAFFFSETVPDAAKTVEVQEDEAMKLKDFALHLNSLARKKNAKAFAKFCRTPFAENLEEHFLQLAEIDLAKLQFLNCSANKLNPELKNVYFRNETDERIHLVLQKKDKNLLFRGMYVYAK